VGDRVAGHKAARFDQLARRRDGRRVRLDYPGAVVYWGDMDADGLEILDGFRAAGVPAVSILMDAAAYEAWEHFGTNVD
jgi:hypothetical protein